MMFDIKNPGRNTPLAVFLWIAMLVGAAALVYWMLADSGGSRQTVILMLPKGADVEIVGGAETDAAVHRTVTDEDAVRCRLELPIGKQQVRVTTPDGAETVMLDVSEQDTPAFYQWQQGRLTAIPLR